MRWVVAAAVAVVAVGMAFAGILLTREPSLDELMTRRAEAALERAQPLATGEPSAHGGGHAQPADPNRRTDLDGHELRCVAKVFGYDPPSATTIDDVTAIYAHRMCAAVGPGLAWPDAIRETGPVAVRLGVPDELVMPEKLVPDDTEVSYPERIRAVIPARYHNDALAFADFVNPDVAEELQDRLAD